MPKFRAKPLLVRAEQVSLGNTEQEAARIRAGLQVDFERLRAGGLWGLIEFSNSRIGNSDARSGQWIVRWPDGELSTMTDEQFRLLFVPATEINPDLCEPAC